MMLTHNFCAYIHVIKFMDSFSQVTVHVLYFADPAVLMWLAENVSQSIILAVECHLGQMVRAWLDGEESNYRDNFRGIQ